MQEVLFCPRAPRKLCTWEAEKHAYLGATGDGLMRGAFVETNRITPAMCKAQVVGKDEGASRAQVVLVAACASKQQRDAHNSATYTNTLRVNLVSLFY